MLPPNEITVISVPREIDWLNAPALREQVKYFLMSGMRNFIFDFNETDFVDSAGMGILLHLNQRIVETQGSVTFINVSPSVMRILALGKLLDFIPTTGSQSFYSRQVSSRPQSTPEWIKTLRIPDDKRCMAAIRKRISDMIEPLELGGSAHFDFMLAVGEALGNAFDHSGHVEMHHILVTITCYPDRIVVEVTDRGQGFLLEKGELPQISETRGRGIRLMHLLADGVEISARGNHRGGGTRVRLVKLF